MIWRITLKNGEKVIFHLIVAYMSFWLCCPPYIVGNYMLMDSIEAVPGFKAEIISPLTASSGCLDLTFHYYMYGTANTMELSVHTLTAGKKLGLS